MTWWSFRSGTSVEFSSVTRCVRDTCTPFVSTPNGVPGAMMNSRFRHSSRTFCEFDEFHHLSARTSSVFGSFQQHLLDQWRTFLGECSHKTIDQTERSQCRHFIPKLGSSFSMRFPPTHSSCGWAFVPAKRSKFPREVT